LPAKPVGARFISITTSDDLYRAVDRAIRKCDALVMCAAVADYKPAKVQRRKMKKQKMSFALQLVPTQDILASLSHRARKFLVIGFAAETHDLEIRREESFERRIATSSSRMMLVKSMWHGK
jgi:phosphopantothenoylcysteine decarboxylase/phosphopantothenate--cysteine ligase